LLRDRKAARPVETGVIFGMRTCSRSRRTGGQIMTNSMRAPDRERLPGER